MGSAAAGTQIKNLTSLTCLLFTSLYCRLFSYNENSTRSNLTQCPEWNFFALIKRAIPLSSTIASHTRIKSQLCQWEGGCPESIWQNGGMWKMMLLPHRLPLWAPRPSLPQQKQLSAHFSCQSWCSILPQSYQTEFPEFTFSRSIKGVRAHKDEWDLISTFR